MRVIVKKESLEEIKENEEMYDYIKDHERIVNVRKSGLRFYIIGLDEAFLYKGEFDILPDEIILPKELFEI